MNLELNKVVVIMVNYKYLCINCHDLSISRLPIFYEIGNAVVGMNLVPIVLNKVVAIILGVLRISVYYHDLPVFVLLTLELTKYAAECLVLNKMIMVNYKNLCYHDLPVTKM